MALSEMAESCPSPDGLGYLMPRLRRWGEMKDSDSYDEIDGHGWHGIAKHVRRAWHAMPLRKRKRSTVGIRRATKHSWTLRNGTRGTRVSAPQNPSSNVKERSALARRADETSH